MKLILRPSPRIPPFAVSAALHALVLSLVVWGPPSAPGHVLPADASLLKKYKVVWSRLPKLPEISPGPRLPANQTIPRPLPPAAQTVFSTSADAVPRKQLIWRPPPVPVLEQEIPSPNMALFKMPDAPAPPAKPAPKTFVAPAPTPREAAISILPAPQIAEPKLSLPAAASPGTWTGEMKLKPPTRAFVPPSSQGRSTQTAGSAPVLEAAPTITVAGAENSNLSALVVGLEPADQLKAPLPAGRLPAQVSAKPGEIVGATAGGPGGRGLSVPDLVVRGGKTESAVATETLPRATAQERSQAAARATVSAPLRASSRVVPRAVEASFRDRTLYMCLLEMPIPSEDLGNSVLWFAERDAKEGSALLMRAPVLVRAEAPVPPASLPAGRERKVYLRMAIGREGLVKSVALLEPVEDSLSEGVVRASAKWEFVPAIRNGQPVEIEAIVEVPFRSAVRASGK